jgi:hypothetical protein
MFDDKKICDFNGVNFMIFFKFQVRFLYLRILMLLKIETHTSTYI